MRKSTVAELAVFQTAMPATPWSSSSSLVSDRLNPVPHNKPKGKANSNRTTPEPPKSQAIHSLEARLTGAREFTGRPKKDPTGGCFCQARTHALSSDASICHHCGLILCALNPAHRACPHCTEPLLDPRTHRALVEKLESELTAQLVKEEAERQRAIEEARAAEGAFPTLPGSRPHTQTQPVNRSGMSQSTARTQAPHSAATRTVLSLNSASGKVKVSSFSTPTVVGSRLASVSAVESKEDEKRVPRPSRDVMYVKELPDSDRPWKAVRAGDVSYVPLPGETGRSRRRGKGTGREAASGGQSHS